MDKPIAIKVKASDKRNEMHFETQLRNRMHVFDDRRRRKPKHKPDYRDIY